jgi:hypothetical protein
VSQKSKKLKRLKNLYFSYLNFVVFLKTLLVKIKRINLKLNNSNDQLDYLKKSILVSLRMFKSSRNLLLRILLKLNKISKTYWLI